MSTMTMYKRPEAEMRINAALEKLYPDGEILGTMLERYTPWQEVKDIPLMEMGRVCAQLEKEPGFLEFLGEDKYFTALTVGMKIALYQAALDQMQDVLATAGYQRNDGITFDKFRTVWNTCIKECVFPAPIKAPRNTDKPRPAKKKAAKTRGQKVSNNDIKQVKEAISFLNITSGRSFRPTSKATQTRIIARINEGFTLEDFKQVIADRCDKWNHVPIFGEKDMRDYLRPETLFGTKFEGYLNAAKAAAPTDDGLESPVEYVPMKKHDTPINKGAEHEHAE